MYVSNILKRENNNLDFIRLLTALMVVWYHAHTHFPDSFPHMPIMHPRVLDLGPLAVCIFFFISGLLVTNSLLTKKEAVPFVISRFFRIYPAYIVMLILCVFVLGPIFTTLSTLDYFSSHQTWSFFLKNAVLNIQGQLPGVWEDMPQKQINVSIWTIPFEVTCYIIVLFGFILHRKFKLSHWVIVIPALIMAFLPKELSKAVLGFGYIFFERPHFFCFVIGTLFAIYKDKIKIDKTIVFSLILLTVVFYHWVSVIEFLFPITVAITLLYCSSVKPILGWRLPHDISYGIYIFHDTIMQIVCNNGLAHTWLVCFFITAVITIPVAYLSARFIEEPALLLAKKLSAKKYPIANNGILVLGVFAVAILIAKFCY